MANIGQFDSDQEETMDFTPLPAGDYLIQAEISEVKETKAGDGHYLQVEFRVLQGDHENRKLWDRFTLANPSERAVQVGRGKLAGLCRAAGRPQINDSAEVHGIPVMARVRVRPASSDYPEQNEISSYRAVEATKAEPTKPNGGKKAALPWAKK